MMANPTTINFAAGNISTITVEHRFYSSVSIKSITANGNEIVLSLEPAATSASSSPTTVILNTRFGNPTTRRIAARIRTVTVDGTNRANGEFTVEFS